MRKREHWLVGSEIKSVDGLLTHQKDSAFMLPMRVLTNAFQCNVLTTMLPLCTESKHHVRVRQLPAIANIASTS